MAMLIGAAGLGLAAWHARSRSSAAAADTSNNTFKDPKLEAALAKTLTIEPDLNEYLPEAQKAQIVQDHLAWWAAGAAATSSSAPVRSNLQMASAPGRALNPYA
jgi:hypothetical protein